MERPAEKGLGTTTEAYANSKTKAHVGKCMILFRGALSSRAGRFLAVWEDSMKVVADFHPSTLAFPSNALPEHSAGASLYADGCRCAKGGADPDAVAFVDGPAAVRMVDGVATVLVSDRLG